jgi:hypothetical protein
MGAFLRFKRETGREATEMTNDLTDLLTFLYCCTASASAADGIEFNFTLEEFADLISPDELNQWTAAMQAEAAEAEATTEGEKKALLHHRAIRLCTGGGGAYAARLARAYA